jgi:hypothetical protein
MTVQGYEFGERSVCRSEVREVLSAYELEPVSLSIPEFYAGQSIKLQKKTLQHFIVIVIR